jgi:hypothetical protein
MCYWFERGNDYIRCEVRTAGLYYELHITRPDGTESVERFAEAFHLYGRQVNLEQRLLDAGWNGPHKTDGPLNGSAPAAGTVSARAPQHRHPSV